MEIPLRGFRRVQKNTFRFIFKHWKTVFPQWEKIALLGIALLFVLTSATWAWAASQSKTAAPSSGGSSVEGIISHNIDSVDLGRLVKSGLTRVSDKGEIIPDLANSWIVSEDKLDYKFILNDNVTASEIDDQIKKTPTFLPNSQISVIDSKTLDIRLSAPDSSVLFEMSQPIFPIGPFEVQKKTNNEIRLKRNADYHLQKPYLDKLTIRIYPDAAALQKAAEKNKITGAVDLTSQPKNWKVLESSLSKKHFLFLNSARTALKKTQVRSDLLAGKKPSSISTLDVLEVNGQQEDADYLAWKEQLKGAGVQLNVRTVPLKDALKEDLPKRNYDILYILISEGKNPDPFLLWNSSQRSSTGQNFAELADADLDVLTLQYRNETDPAKKAEVGKKIQEFVDGEKVSVEYKNLTSKYYVSSKIKGASLPTIISSPLDRFSYAASWFVKEKKVR